MADTNKEIKELLESGFDDLNLIAFELQIPLEQVEQCKKELEAEKRKSATVKQKNREENRGAKQKTSKMEQMREKSKQLISGGSKSEARPKLSQQDMELIEEVLANVKAKIDEMDNLSKREKREVASDILCELKRIENYNLTMGQAREFVALLNSEKLKNIKMKKDDEVEYLIKRRCKIILKEFIQAAKCRQYETEDLEELKELERQITSDMVKLYPLLAEQVKREISTKIERIQQQSALDRLRNNIPTQIKSIITDLVNGTIDIEQANAIIDEEARKKVKSKPRTRFSMTEEQERRQILLQIRTAIIEKAEKYPIQNPEVAISNIHKLCGGDLGMSISTVARNLIVRNDLKMAKGICDDFTGDDIQPEIRAYIKILRDEIRHAEISNVVLAGLNRNGTPEEDRKYFGLIEKGISMGNVNLEAVSLGKRADGSKVTLADIWPDQPNKSK